ncbi:hypothetical protein OROGR_010909 [Orobanche gracilis]
MLEESSFDFGRVLAVSGSAQQHGSVYWENGSSLVLSSLDSEKPLKSQLGDAFSIAQSPIWMDCSTTQQCRAFEEAVGGAYELSKLTGSCAHKRYAGPQIRKIFETQRNVYDDTKRISLISSFMASLFMGGYACIDHTDGATASDLEKKLGDLAPAHAVADIISRKVVWLFNGSGDNPNSLAGLTLNTPGDLATSLETHIS